MTDVMPHEPAPGQDWGHAKPLLWTLTLGTVLTLGLAVHRVDALTVESALPALLVSALSSLALMVAAWFAPLKGARSTAGTPLAPWDTRWNERKVQQLGAATAATLGLTWLNVLDPGMALVTGIVVALLFGFMTGRSEEEPQHEADTPDGQGA